MKLDSSDLKVLRDRIKVSEQYADTCYLKARHPDRMRQWFQGKHYEPNSSLAKVLEMDRIVVNYALINILVKKAAIAYGEPNFRVKAKRKEFGEQLRVVKPGLDYTWREIKASEACVRAFYDCKVTGTGMVGTNWRFETATMAYQDSRPEAEAGVVVYDNPEVRRIKPEWLLLDPDAVENWRKGWYAGEKWRCALGQMKGDPRYKHLADKLRGEVTNQWYGTSGDRNQQPIGGSDDHLRMVEGYTVYLRDKGLVVHWTEEIPDEPLWVGAEPGYDYPTDWAGRPYFPYVKMVNIPDLETHYGLSDTEVTETQQAEIDLARSQLAMVRRQNNGQTVIPDGLFDEETLEQMQKGVWGAILKAKGLPPDADLRKVMTQLPRDVIQPELYQSLEAAKRDMSELSRVSAYSRGQNVPGVKYATEAMLMSQENKGLSADERRDFELFVGETAEQVVNLLHRWVEGEREVEVPIEGQRGMEWMPYTRQQMAGDFEFLVEPSSMDAPDSATEEAKWATRLQLIVPLAQMGVNPLPVLEAYLDSFDFPDVEKVLPQPQMMGPPMGPGMVPPPGMGGPEGMMGNEADLGGPEAGLGGEGQGQEEGDLARLLGAGV